MMISTEGLNRSKVLAALRNNARAVRSLRALDPRSHEPMTARQVFELLHDVTDMSFGVLQGRVLKVDLSSTAGFDPTGYDRANGEGHAAKVINPLRETGSVEKINPPQ